MLLPRLLFLVALTSNAVVWGSPVLRQTDRQSKLEQLREQFPGIYWDTAADPDECTDEQFNILAESVRVAALDMMPFGLSHQQMLQSSAFNRFFIRPFEVGVSDGWIDGAGNAVPGFSQIVNAIENVARFPTEGKRDRNGNYVRSKQIKFRCKAWPGLGCGQNTGARTSEPSVDFEDPGWSTVFCPAFFRTCSYINDLGNHAPRPPSQLPLLRAFEHSVIHELMHADIASGQYENHHIADVAAPLPGQNGAVEIYGATRSHQYAWVKAQKNTSRPGVNPLVGRNADNYAWFFTNAWFAKRWNWNDDGRNLVLDAGLDEDLESLTFEFDDSTDPSPDTIAPDPPNCWVTSDGTSSVNYYCAYMGTSADQWLADAGQPFVSRGGCELSSQCRMPFGNTTTIDPACTCKCGGDLTTLSDPKCEGFAGSVPNQSTTTSISAAPPSV